MCSDVAWAVKSCTESMKVYKHIISLDTWRLVEGGKAHKGSIVRISDVLRRKLLFQLIDVSPLEITLERYDVSRWCCVRLESITGFSSSSFFLHLTSLFCKTTFGAASTTISG